jgi:uncharacterized protein
MPASSLLTLIDDIATLLDDVAVITKVAAKKVGGVVGDDLALNAEQVTGVTTERELPVVWAVAKGSMLNKVILVPAALVISAFIPRAILPLLMLGGLFLCYEGFEKVWHKLVSHDDGQSAERTAHLKAMTDGTIDVVALEKDKIEGAIRTDFILSAEIVVIALGTVASQPLTQQVVSLSILAVGITIAVYGLVAAIVKIDDLGLRLTRASSTSVNAVGAGILRAAPVLMRGLSLIGTAAMFMVGGSIIAHAIPFVEHATSALIGQLAPASGVLHTLVKSLSDAVVGIVAGGIAVVAITAGKRVLGRP